MKHFKCKENLKSSRWEMYDKDFVPKNFAKFTRKHLLRSLFKLMARKFIKKILWHWCFPVNFVKFLRTLVLSSTFERLLQFYRRTHMPKDDFKSCKATLLQSSFDTGVFL